MIDICLESDTNLCMMLRQLIHRSSTTVKHTTRPYHPLSKPRCPRHGSHSLPAPVHLVAFHSTPQRQAGPLVPIFAAMLKASTSLELARMAGRIALTFMPFILLTNLKSKRKIHRAALRGQPASEERKAHLLKQIRHRKIILYGLMFIPVTLFWATIVASLEKTPLTGRWRMIILSPEEEEEIAAQLAGPGWYNAVGEILSQDGTPKIIPPTDWRYSWVDKTLRKLEATIPVLINEPTMYPQWSDEDQDHPPMPPPAQYPLRPRPRASEYIRWVCESICERKVTPMPHSIPGPPYSLLLVDRPDASNAFSYGFGPDGGGGIVVYSGFLNDVLARTPMSTPSATPVEEKPWWSWLLGSIFSGSPPPPPRPTPTPEQTSELAILLAHELSHLVLSHHLESLSSATVIIPGTLSIVTDIIRVAIFPVTMLFGPFVNDALAQLGKVGSGELIKVGEYCTSVKQEIEADVVSARLLAHAGFDAREAVKFWEVRSSECSKSLKKADTPHKQPSPNLARRIMGASHPVNEIRVDCLKDELARWENERRSAMARLHAATPAV